MKTADSSWMGASAYRCHGAALTETFILSVVLVPMLFLFPLIGRIGDLKSTTDQAGRYLAWEHSVGSGNSGRQDVVARFYEQPGAAILTGQRSRNGDQAFLPLWEIQPDNTETAVITESGSGDSSGIDPLAVPDDLHAPLSIRFGDGAGVSEETGGVPGFSAGILSKGIGEIAGAMNFASGAEWDASEEGLYTSGIQLEIASHPLLPISGTSCTGQSGSDSLACLSSATTLLVDGWGVGDIDHALRRTRAMVPATALDPVGEALSVVGKLPMFTDLEKLEDAFGHVDADPLPPHATERHRGRAR